MTLRPACEEVIGECAWSTPHPEDLDRRNLCSFCFRGVDSIDEIEQSREELVVSPGGACIHRSAETGEPDYKAVNDEGRRKSLRRRLQTGEVSPDDIAFDPLGGESDV